MLKGSCACGRIKYTCSAMPDEMSNCHCHTCRKLGGGPFLAFASVPRTSIRWLNSPPDIWKRSDVAERGFCSNCGSALSMVYYCDMDRYSLTASSIDESREPLPKACEHIFLKEKAPWFVLPEDGAERFDAMPGAFEAKMEKWLKENAAKD